MGLTKFIWDPHDLVGFMWILSNQRECVEKCMLKCVSSNPQTVYHNVGIISWLSDEPTLN
jgi:hypothetical protein